MQKRVLIISGSPRKNGNSQLLCERFQEGAKASGHHVDLIQIAERQIGFCRACDGCMRNNGICVLYDDMAEILEIFQKADVLVLATPVYFYTMCCQMKIMIDRCCARYTEISNKEFYFIIAAAENSKAMMERTIDGFRGFLDCLEAPQEKGVVYGVGAWKVGEIKDTPHMKEAYEMGKRI